MSKRNSDYDTYETRSGGSGLLKTIIIGAVGTIASYYASQWAMRLLEEKPLKARIREGKAKVADIKGVAVSKVSDVKTVAKGHASRLASKAKSLIDDKADQAVDALDDVKDQVELGKVEAKDKLDETKSDIKGL